jgi:small-conductance mechanosensitive channel
MSSPFTTWSSFSLANVLHLAAILIIALILNRLLRVLTKLLVRPAASQSRVAQSREQQTRTLAGVLYSAGSKIVWAVAILTALSEFGINVTPLAALAGLASLALGFGAQNLIRDIITGFYIVMEDQYVVGDTIQVGETLGRVEHVTLRRTVVRDGAGGGGRGTASGSELVAGFGGWAAHSGRAEYRPQRIDGAVAGAHGANATG